MTIETLTRDVADLKRRVDLAETKLSQQAGQFEFITGQLRDVQLYMHGKFADVGRRFDDLDSKIDGLDAKVDSLPRAVAELIAGR